MKVTINIPGMKITSPGRRVSAYAVDLEKRGNCSRSGFSGCNTIDLSPGVHRDSRT